MSKFYSEMSSVSPPEVFWLLLYPCIAVASEIAAVPVLIFISPYYLSWNDTLTILVAAPLVALLVGLPSWWLFVVRPRCATIRRGTFIGVLDSIIAHLLVCMFISPVRAFVSPGSLLFSIPMVLLQAIFMYAAAASLSLLLVGWFTALIGGVTGFLLIYLQRTLTHYWRRGKFPKDDITQLY